MKVETFSEMSWQGSGDFEVLGEVFLRTLIDISRRICEKKDGTLERASSVQYNRERSVNRAYPPPGRWADGWRKVLTLSSQHHIHGL